MSPKVPHLNMVAVAMLRNDVARLNGFAEATGVPQLKQCFAELDDLTSALMHQDLLQFGENPTLLQSLFPRLDPMKLANVLAKVARSPKAYASTNLAYAYAQLTPTPISATANGRSLPRLDKKLVANLVKQLKANSLAR